VHLLVLFPVDLDADHHRRERAGDRGRGDEDVVDQVQRRTLSIAGRAIASLIQTQGVGDLYRIYLVLRRDGVAFNLAFIPPTFNAKQAEDFDPVYMTKLFNLGYERAAAPGGYPWSTRPPGFIEATGTPAADDVQAK